MYCRFFPYNISGSNNPQNNSKADFYVRNEKKKNTPEMRFTKTL